MDVLRDGNFRLLFSARAISYVGTYLAPIAVAFAVLDLGGSATQVGLSFAAWTVAQVATLALGGVVGDRLPRRTVMIGSDTASFAVRTTMGVLLVTGHADVWELIVLQACGGAAVAFYSPASYGLVREVVRDDQLQQANSFLAIARYAAFPLGAAVGGTIVATVGSGAALLFDAGTYGTSALLLSQLRGVRSAARAGAGVLRELREGWSAFVEQQWVWVTCLWVACYFLFTYAPFFVLGPYIAKHSMNGAGSWAAVVTGEGVGSLVGSFLALRVRYRRPLLAVGLLFLPTAVQSVLLAFHAPVELLAPAAALAGFAFAGGSIVWDTALQRTIPPEKLARVSAYGWMSAMVFLPAGYALAGPVASVVGMQAYLLFGAAWLVASTAVVYRLPSVRGFTYEEPPETAPVAAPS